MVNLDTQCVNTLLFIGLLLVIAIVLLAWQLYHSQKKNHRMETYITTLEAHAHAAQRHEMDYKLNPHLFKNVLNAIQSHAYQTYHSLDSLSMVLDYILYESKKKYVTPSQEIAFAHSLIEINKIKLSPLFDLQIKDQVRENEPLLHQKLMAPLLSIDLIENAFKHADLQSANSFISITIGLKDNSFSMTVANKISTKVPMRKDQEGYGTKLLAKRLDLIYKENYHLERFIEDDVFIAHLKIDLLEHKAKMFAAR